MKKAARAYLSNSAGGSALWLANSSNSPQNTNKEIAIPLQHGLLKERRNFSPVHLWTKKIP